MDLLTFQKAAKRTIKDLSIGGSHVLDVAHMPLGFASEASELAECIFNNPSNIDRVNLGEELGDKMWYAVNYATLRNIDLSKFVFGADLSARSAFVDIIIYGGRMADYAKRWLCGTPIENQRGYSEVKENMSLFGYINSIYQMAKDHGLDMEEIMGRNIVKLYCRYPEKFVSDHELTRNLEEERLILEEKQC